MSEKEKQGNQLSKSDPISIESLSGPGGSGLVRLQPSQARLPSLRPKQDLTLGKSQKKTFAPTIPADRRIKREPTQSTEKPVKKVSKSFSNAKKGGRKKERNDVIKSESIFSMGPGGKKIVRGKDSLGTSRVSQSGDLIRNTSVIKEKHADPTIKEELDDSEDELGYIPGQKNKRIAFGSSGLPPCQLPLEEPNGIASATQLLTADQSGITAAQLLTADDHTLNEHHFFMQLPDCLPAATSSPNDLANISRVSEGQIGKLQIHKSGKVSLFLGSVSLDVSIGTPCGFLQELVCIHPSSPDPKMTSIGHLSHRLICTPDFEDMLSSDS